MDGTSSEEILKWTRGRAPESMRDELAAEEPLEVRVGGQSVSVTMRTPGHDAELAAGFLLTEGMIRAKDDLRDVAVDALANIADVQLAPHVEVDLSRLTRHVFASSSCGLCGKATIDSIHANFPQVESDIEVDADVLLTLPEKLRAAQATFSRTGGLHATGLFTAEGELLICREDVGRHNAVDKVLGRALMDGLLPLSRHVLLVSGRSSFEIMQKTLAAAVPVVAAVSAPSSLAVQFAREGAQTLVGFLREGRMNVYAHPERVRFG